MKEVDLGEPTSFLDYFFWVALKENAKQVKILWTITEICLNSGCQLEVLKNGQKLKLQENLRQTLFLHGPMTWKVMQRNAWKDTANLRTKRLNSSTTSQRHAWITINSEKRK